MTVSTINSVAEFVTNGITKSFPFYFKFLEDKDLVVTFINPDGAGIPLTLGTHYAVSGAGNENGGSITTTAVLGGPGKLFVSRVMPVYQQTSLRNQGKFLAGTHEDVFDRLTMLIQQTDAIFSRAIRSTDYETLPQLPPAATRAKKVMGFDSAGNPSTSNLTLEQLEQQPALAMASAAAAQASAREASVSEALAGEAAIDADGSAKAAAVESGKAAHSAQLAGIALGTARVFTTVAEGLLPENTVSGQYFSVPSADSNECLILYLNNVGAEVEVKRYPSASALKAIREMISPIKSPQSAADVYSLTFEDGFGNAAGGVLLEGILSFLKAQFGSADITRLGGGGYDIRQLINASLLNALCDAGGNAAYAVKESGAVAFGSIETTNIAADLASFKTLGAKDAKSTFGIAGSQVRVRPEIVGITSYGQSNSQAGAAVSVQPYDTLVFNGGAAWPDSGLSVADAHAALVPITTALARPQIEGWTECLKERLLVENGLSTADISYQVLASVTGVGGYTLAQLERGTVPYNNILADVEYGLALANAAGKTYEFGAFSFVHGESENSAVGAATYSYRVKKIFADLTADVMARSPRANPPICISWQINGNPSGWLKEISKLQVSLMDELPDYYVATPSYWLTTRGDNVHLSDIAYTKLFAYCGLVHKRVLFDGLGWQPLKPVAVLRQDKNLLVRFNMPAGGKLVLDTATISLATNYGFDLYDAAGAEVSISSVSLIGPDTVKITCAAAIPAGGRVDYAINSTIAVGNEFTARGNLRDDAGLTRIYAAGGANYPLHNWSVVFSKEF